MMMVLRLLVRWSEIFDLKLREGFWKQTNRLMDGHLVIEESTENVILSKFFFFFALFKKSSV